MQPGPLGQATSEQAVMSDRHPSPNINIGQVYDQRYSDSEVHYDRFFQMHYIKSGTVRVYLDDQQFIESAPMFFFTQPTVPHSFVTEADSDGYVLTVRQQLVSQLIEAAPSLLPAGMQVRPACVALGRVLGWLPAWPDGPNLGARTNLHRLHR